VIGMEMTDKNVIDQCRRDLQGQCVANAAISQIKEETPWLHRPISKLHKHGCALL